MCNALLGRKLGMTQVFNQEGNRVPVTVVEVGPCVVVRKLTPARNGYSAVQIGFQPVAGAKLNKPRRGVFEKSELQPMKNLIELRLEPSAVEALKIGESLTVSIFKEGELVDVVGRSKGRGFQGVVKRWHFAGFPRTRGTHEYRRHPGSIGMREKPGKILKGKKMPGHMGNERVTVQNVKVERIDAERNLMLLNGSVPGHNGALVLVRRAKKASKK